MFHYLQIDNEFFHSVMEGTDCLPMEMAVSLAGNPTLIMLDSSGALHIPADDTVALAAAQGIKIEEVIACSL